MSDSHICLNLLALRDFFMAKNAVQMREAYHNLSEADMSAPQNIDWVETEYAFNKIFIGPEPPLAPLYASCYLEQEPRLMGKSTVQMRELMQAMGLDMEVDMSTPDDHIALELEVWVRLEYLIEQKNSKEFAESVEQARSWLISEHIALWLPKFVECTLKNDNLAINYVVNCLEKCVLMQNQALTSEPNLKEKA